MFQSTSSLSKMRFPFYFTKYVFSSLCQPPLHLFCATLTLHCCQGHHMGSPTNSCTWEPIFLVSAVRTPLERRRYSSEREREMRGPFLISFLFSSFLLLFSSSLRIFLKASAVWSTCDQMTFWWTTRFKLALTWRAGPTGYSHRLALCGMDSWSPEFSPLFPAPVTSEHPVIKQKLKKRREKDTRKTLLHVSLQHRESEPVNTLTQNGDIRSPAAAASLEMNPLCNSPAAWLRSHI